MRLAKENAKAKAAEVKQAANKRIDERKAAK